MTPPQIKVLPDLPAIAAEAAGKVVGLAGSAITEKGKFSISLSGGETPRALYAMLALPEFRDQVEWTKVDVFFGDERCVPPDHQDSNYRMARETLLSRVPIPGDNVYRIRGEADPEEAAIEYGKLLKEKFGDGGPDLVLLGMGADGHTASLFPGTTALKETRHRCVSVYVEPLKAWRVTTTAPFINRGGQILVLVAGKNKAERVSQVLEGPADPEHMPIQLIAPASGRYVWLLDAGAAGME